jgi:hypothetical protein
MKIIYIFFLRLDLWHICVNINLEFHLTWRNWYIPVSMDINDTKKRLFFVQYNGETKQESVNNLDGFILCSFMKVSIRNVGDKQQRRVFWESYLLLYLANKYCYRVRSSAVTYLYVKRDKEHVTCTVCWNWLQWKTRWFVSLLNLVSDYLSPFYKPAYDILVGRHDT